MPTYESQYDAQFEEDESEDKSQETRLRCRHIFTAGRRCASPCLRAEQFCYHHHTTRRPVVDPKARLARTGTFELPNPEDRDAIREAVSQVMHAIAHNTIDLKRAGMLLYSLQISLCALPPQSRPAPMKTNPSPSKTWSKKLSSTKPTASSLPKSSTKSPKNLNPANRSLAR